jgi:hypothetical protein
VVWATIGGDASNGVLYAYRAENLSLLWCSAVDVSAQFVGPTVADGRVFVGTSDAKVEVFGLGPVPSGPYTPGATSAFSCPSLTTIHTSLAGHFANEREATALPARRRAEIQVPSGYVKAFEWGGDGVQTYRAQAHPPEGLTWMPVGVDVTLRAADREVDARRKAVPPLGHTDETNLVAVDGTRIFMRLVRSASAADRTGVPWELFEVTKPPANGALTGIAFVQRADTDGGRPPTVAPRKAGEVTKVSFLARYAFYRPLPKP